VTEISNDVGHGGNDVGHVGHRTPVAVPVARFDDPHLQEASRHPRRTERVIAVVFVLGMLAIAGFGAAYWVNAAPWLIAVTFGGGLFLLGFGLTAWGKYLMPQGPFVEERHTLASSEDERNALSAALVERTGVVVKRRRMLGGLFAGGAVVFGIVALFPLVRSMGPLPGDSLEVTDWRADMRLVDSNGQPVHVDTLDVGGIMTVFPHGYQNSDNGQTIDQTILIRVSTEDVTTQPGRDTWGPQGYVAYSKLCTHLGCPVGLYEQQLQLLVCPCHQSMFNVLNGCLPIFGPAPRPLPQLPLSVDSDGYLVAQTGYDQPVGPGFWERTTT
jgi:ubiquinol-cytochrome c reductase iron-sulfur subunit